MTTRTLFIPTLIALALPAAAQVPASPAPGNAGAVATSIAPSASPQDGIVFHNGRAYLLRGGRASLIDSALVPNGQVLTNDGQLVPLSPGLTGFPQGGSPGGTQAGSQQGQATQQGQSTQQGQGTQQMQGSQNRGTSPTGAASSNGAAGSRLPGVDAGTATGPGVTQPGAVQRTPVTEPGLPNTLPGPANASPVAPSPGSRAPANAQPGTRIPGNVTPGNTSQRSTAPAAGNNAAGIAQGTNSQQPAQSGAAGTSGSSGPRSGTGGTSGAGSGGTSGGATGGGSSGGGSGGGGSGGGGASGGGAGGSGGR